jgi:hypothetical protein
MGRGAERCSAFGGGGVLGPDFKRRKFAPEASRRNLRLGSHNTLFGGLHAFTGSTMMAEK